MLIVEFKVDYKHTERRTWLAGETPTVSRGLGKKLVNELGVAEWVGEGCGCPGIDQATIERHTALATRGITEEELDAQDAGEELKLEPAISKQDGHKKGKN